MPAVPEFPAPTVLERTLELGFGSGPWERSELADKWGEATANRFINDAKKAGWLLAPFRNVFFVPPARDLMLVGWLPPGLREEFIISRLLTASGLRNWCFSAWARSQGLVFPQPLFVTDLAPVPELRVPFPTPRWQPEPEPRRRERVVARAEGWGRLPFLDNVVIVPEMPLSTPIPRPATAVLPEGTPQKFGQPAWPGEDLFVRPDLAPEEKVRLIPYTLTPDVDDPAWIAAVVAALRLPRFAERMEPLVKGLLDEDAARPRRAKEARRRLGRDDFMDRWERWLGTMGEPESNGTWKERLRTAPVAFLLVPAWLWDEFNAARLAERFVEMSAWRRVLGARS